MDQQASTGADPGTEAAPLFVQAFRLTKQVPGSFKCPDVYGLPHFNSDGKLTPYQYFQFGTGVRTWWSLNFTQPGTKFILEVVSVDRAVLGGSPLLHKDIDQIVAGIIARRKFVYLCTNGLLLKKRLARFRPSLSGVHYPGAVPSAYGV